MSSRTGYLAPSALPAPVVVQGKPAASRGEAASEESATAAGNAVDMGLKTVGTLDLGGSSLEVTFLPTSTPRQPATGTTSSSLAGHKSCPFYACLWPPISLR